MKRREFITLLGGAAAAWPLVVRAQQKVPIAHRLGLDFVALEIKRAVEIVPAIEAVNSRAEALYVCADPLLLANALRINTLALGSRLPTMHALREFVDASGLMSYGPNFPDLWRRAGAYVDKILRGCIAQGPKRFNSASTVVIAEIADPRSSIATITIGPFAFADRHHACPTCAGATT